MLDAALTIRRQLRPADGDAIVEIHRRVYEGEYGMSPAFTAAVADGVREAIAGGWPQAGGGAWLIDGRQAGTLAGSLGLTREGPELGRVRWFVFEPQMRGRGLGRRLVGELLAQARAQGMTRLELETYSDLTAAAHLYRQVGFSLCAAVQRDDWGRPITYQRYALNLTSGSPATA